MSPNIRPTSAFFDAPLYPFKRTGSVDALYLDLNERVGGADPKRARYDNPNALEAELATRFNLAPEQVLVTAGSSDGILRLYRAMLSSEREVILPSPTFEMLARYAQLNEAGVIRVPWTSGAFPTDDIIAKATDKIAIIAVVSPNNPTGLAATIDDVRRISEACPSALLLLDMAYIEFADVDFTQAALELPNVVITRTFSKAYGLAGLRVGYALGPSSVIRWMKAGGAVFGVSSEAAQIALDALVNDEDTKRYIEQVRRERRELEIVLNTLGAVAIPSQANFVLASFENAESVQRALQQHGIFVRRFVGNAELEGTLRITCPGDEMLFKRLLDALRSI
jgi:histidinol-phosphate aminotransferase